jgi:hypothetical protein
MTDLFVAKINYLYYGFIYAPGEDKKNVAFANCSIWLRACSTILEYYILSTVVCWCCISIAVSLHSTRKK